MILSGGPIAGQMQAYSDSKKLRSNIKFNRKQESSRGDKKKLEPLGEITDRICFISPQKSSSNQSNQCLLVINSPKFTRGQQNLLSCRQQSCILPQDSPPNNDQKLNDSMLSLMQQLKGDNQRKFESQMQEYLQLISDLREEIENLSHQNKILKKKAKDVEMLQQFLIERQGYISEVTNRNITLNQELHLLQKQKQQLIIDVQQLKADLHNQREMYEIYINTLKSQKDIQKQEFDTILKLNIQLNQKLQNSSTRKPLERFKRDQEIDSPRKLARDNIENKKYHRIHRKTQKVCKIQATDGCDTLLSKQTDLSELNVKSMDEYSILKKLSEPFDQCQCINITKQLRQKIRYNEIEIDILKRIKVSGQKTKEQNEKLKQKNKKLMSKLNNLSSKIGKVDRKRSINSDSSLQLSLSPKKH